MEIGRLKEPTDSSMMVGAFRLINAVRDVAPYFNSPLGCPFHILIAWSRHNRETLNYLQSMITEIDVVTGIEEKLERGLRKAAAKVRGVARALVVISSDPPELTGTDTQGVVESIAAEQGSELKIIPLSTAGFKGDHVAGYRETALKLLEAFAKEPSKKISRSVNILGVVEDEMTARGDVREIRRMLKALGLGVNAVLFMDCTTEDIGRASEAQCNIVLHPEYGLVMAEFLQQGFGMPYICLNPPFGFEGTAQWLREVAAALGLEGKAQRFIQGEERRVYPRLSQADQYLTGRRVASHADPTVAIGATRLAAELGMEPVLTSFSSASDLCAGYLKEVGERFGFSPRLLVDDNISFKQQARELKVEVIFGSTLHHEIAVELGAYLYAVNYPTTHVLRIYDTPMMGYDGVLFVAQQVGSEMLRRDLFDETVYGVRRVDPGRWIDG